MKKPCVFLKDIKPLLSQLHAPGITPETIVSDGSEAGDAAIQYMLQRIISRVRKRTKPPGGRRGRPKKLKTNEMKKCVHPKKLKVKEIKKRGRPKKVDKK